MAVLNQVFAATMTAIVNDCCAYHFLSLSFITSIGALPLFEVVSLFIRWGLRDRVEKTLKIQVQALQVRAGDATSGEAAEPRDV